MLARIEEVKRRVKKMKGIANWLGSAAFHSFGAPTSWCEVLGFLTGAICVYYVVKQHILNWPIGILNNVLWIILFASAGLFADSMLQVFFIVLAIVGWWNWLHGGPNKNILPVSRTSKKEWFLLSLVGIAGTVIMYYLLKDYMGSTVPIWDGLTTSLSIIATWGQIKKKIESWYLWMIADIIYIPLYQYKHLTLTAILYVGFFALCVWGLIDWIKSEKIEKNSNSLTAPTETLEKKNPIEAVI
jgi:nicotinamide mononucleotide transporter